MTFKLDSDSAQQIRQLLKTQAPTIVEMGHEIGADPSTFYEGEDWSGLDLRPCDLSGISFRNANLDSVIVFEDQIPIIEATRPKSMSQIVVHSRENAGQEATIRPGLLTRIGEALGRLPDAVEAMGRALSVGADVAMPFVDQWVNRLPTDIFELLIKQLRLLSNNIEKAGQRLELKLRPSTRSDGRLPFTIFRDIDEPWCPEMLMLPAGTFLMGSSKDEKDSQERERPQHEVTIGRPFAIGRYPVTFDEYDHFCDVTDRTKAQDKGWGRGRLPVINVEWHDARAYCDWLGEQSGQSYHLPSEAMWEYACRAGTTTAYGYGEEVANEQANFGKRIGTTTEVGSYPPNPWGLCDIHGNVWEWVEDHYESSYEGAPLDGRAWLADSAGYRVLRGGSWADDAPYLRSAFRYPLGPGFRGHSPFRRDYFFGFRCARVVEDA